MSFQIIIKMHISLYPAKTSEWFCECYRYKKMKTKQKQYMQKYLKTIIGTCEVRAKEFVLEKSLIPHDLVITGFKQ